MKWGWDSKRKDEISSEEDDEKLEIKEGLKRRDLKRLQVDLRLKMIFRGRKQKIRSRSSSGRLDQILGSISGGFWHLGMVDFELDLWILERKNEEEMLEINNGYCCGSWFWAYSQIRRRR